MGQPESAEPTIADVLSAIGNLTGVVQGVVTRLEAVEAEQQDQRSIIPQMVEMNDDPKGAMFAGLVQPGDEVGGTLRQKVIGTDGLPRTPHGRVLAKGTRVRLTEASETARVLRSKDQDPSRLVGQIVDLHYINDADEVKYRVRFPGLTTARGDGFYAHELVPA